MISSLSSWGPGPEPQYPVGATPQPPSLPKRAPHCNPLFSSDNDLPALVYRLLPLWFGQGRISHSRTSQRALWTHEKRRAERDQQLVNSDHFEVKVEEKELTRGSGVISQPLPSLDSLCVTAGWRQRMNWVEVIEGGLNKECRLVRFSIDLHPPLVIQGTSAILHVHARWSGQPRSGFLFSWSL